MAIVTCNAIHFQAVQAVLFDKDGTLANSEGFLRNLGQRRSRLIDAQIPGVGEPLLMAFGVEGDRIDPTGLLAVGTRYENEIAAAAYIAETGRSWMESLGIARNAFIEADRVTPRKADETPLMEGAIELLQTLLTAKVRVGILSSDSTSNVEDFVQRYELTPYIHLCMGVDRAPAKPDPALFNQACEAMGVLPNQTLMVGDSTADILMAQAAGAIGCVGITGGWMQTIQLNQADAVIQRLAELAIV
ncbi:MAG: HAD family hydrolase [Leptolyngbyaceae cyanobacterium SL_7_1]|nr:HAD family hydrolase [Leptolyngbyaceae cyanobacterium SL_7_1]